MTRKEMLTKMTEEKNGDFWYAVETLIKQGWDRSDFEDAGIVDVFQNLDNTVEENWEYLEEILNELPKLVTKKTMTLQEKLEKELDKKTINHHPAFATYRGASAVVWDEETAWIVNIDEDGTLTKTIYSKQELSKIDGGPREKALMIDEWMRGE